MSYLESARVVLSQPTYGPILPEVSVSTKVAIMRAALNGVKWLGDASTDRESWSAARSVPSDLIRDYPDADGILWADSDMIYPVDAFARLALRGVDLISGVYFQRKPPYWPNVYSFDPKANKGVGGFKKLLQWEPGKVFPVGGFGFGICYTSTRLLRALPRSPFAFNEFSEDLGFCKMAMDAGFQPYVDTGIECEHYRGPRWVGRKDFERWRNNLGRVTMGGDDAGIHDGGEEDLHGVHSVPALR